MIIDLLTGFGIALLVSAVVLGGFLFALRSPGQSIVELARVFPDTLRLTAALYRDRSLPKSVRWRLRIALVYNIQPINLIPDFIPVIGFADNAIVLAWALRSTVRMSGAEAVERHWTGTPVALDTLNRALRLSGLTSGPLSCAVPAVPEAHRLIGDD